MSVRRLGHVGLLVKHLSFGLHGRHLPYIRPYTPLDARTLTNNRRVIKRYCRESVASWWGCAKNYVGKGENKISNDTLDGLFSFVNFKREIRVANLKSLKNYFLSLLFMKYSVEEKFSFFYSLSFWAADPKGTMSCRLVENFCTSVRLVPSVASASQPPPASMRSTLYASVRAI